MKSGNAVKKGKSMKAKQNMVKYTALGLGLLLAALIIGGLVMIVVKYSDSSADKEWKAIDFSQEFEKEAIKNLVINNEDGKMSIVVGDSFAVQAERVPETFVAKVEGDTLTVDYTEGNSWNSFQFLWFSKNDFHDAVIVITVPEEFYAERCELSNGSGSMETEKLQADNMKLSNGSGKFTMQGGDASDFKVSNGSGTLKVSDVTAGETTLRSGSGPVVMTGIQYGSLDVKSGSGNVELQGRAAGDVSVNSGSGALTLTLENNRLDFSVKADAASGGLWVNGEKCDDFNDKAEAEYIMEIDGGSGRLAIEFTGK